MPRRRCSFASACIEGAVESNHTKPNLNVVVLYELKICACEEEAHNHAQLRFCSALPVLFDVVCAEIKHTGDPLHCNN